MDEPWRAWLAELAREDKLLAEGALPLAFRGYEWRAQVAIVGDFTGYQLIGRIKAAPDAPTSLADMTSEGPVPFMGNTLWEMSLPPSGANSTATLPTDANGETVVKLPFMFTLVPPTGVPYVLAGGIFTMIGSI